MNRFDIALGKQVTSKARREQRVETREQPVSKSRRVKALEMEDTIKTSNGENVSVSGNLDWAAEQLEKEGYADLATRIDQISDQIDALNKKKREKKLNKTKPTGYEKYLETRK
jgi:hypothetical protein